jgi:hypothetical protein
VAVHVQVDQVLHGLRGVDRVRDHLEVVALVQHVAHAGGPTRSGGTLCP